MSSKLVSQFHMAPANLTIQFESNTLVDTSNPFHVLAGAVLPCPQPVPPRPIRKEFTELDLQSIKKKIPAKFVKPSELVRSAFFLMLKENAKDLKSVEGSVFRDRSNHTNAVCGWNDLDLLVLSHDGARVTPDSIKFPKVTCLTIYPRLLEMLPRLQGKIDIAAYFPVNGTVLTNNSDGQYTAIVKKVGGKHTRLPLLDKKVTERFVNIPIESVVIMTFAYRVTESMLTSDVIMDGCMLIADIMFALCPIERVISVPFTSVGKTLQKWQTVSSNNKDEIFALLKTDLYRCARFPGPVAETYLCLDIFCDCKKHLKVMLDHEHIPFMTDVCDDVKSPHDEKKDFALFAPSLDLVEKIAKARNFAYEVYHPNGKKIVRNKHFKSVNNYFDLKRGLMASLGRARVQSLVQLLKDMYTVVFRASLNELCDAFSEQVLQEGSQSPLQPYYSHMTSLVVNHVDRIFNVEKKMTLIQNGKQMSRPTRQELVDVVENCCDDDFMLSHRTVKFIAQTLGWLNDNDGLTMFWSMIKSAVPLQLKNSDDQEDPASPSSYRVNVDREAISPGSRPYIVDQKGEVVGPFYFPGEYVPECDRSVMSPTSFTGKPEKKIVTATIDIPDNVDVDNEEALKAYLSNHAEELFGLGVEVVSALNLEKKNFMDELD